MNKFAKAMLFVVILMAGVTALAAQVSIGVQIGPPPPARVVRVLPPAPGPEFLWIEGYWYPAGHHYKWHEGYWTRPPYPGARWVPARHDGKMFYEGYWAGEHGRVEHDHRWDHDHDRDRRWDRDHGRDWERDHGRDEYREREHDRDDHDRR